METKDKKADALKKDENNNVAPQKELVAPAKVVKMGLNLEKTLNLVNDLHKKATHLTRLKHYAERLQSFEVEQKEEDFENKSYYNGCILTLKDDKSKSFELKNPTLIMEVCEFLAKRFEVKSAELEAEIVLP